MIDATLFPNLSTYEIRSQSDARYNCIAFAAGVANEWWDPSGVWPSHVGPEDTVVNLIEVYTHHGFELCGDSQPESGFDKLAIYATDEGIVYQHAARLGSDGQWLSKLGPDEDIAHPTLDSLEGEKYGRVVAFMRRAATYSQ